MQLDLEELFRLHYDEVARYLKRRVDASTADEVAQNAFTEAFHGRATYDPRLGTPRAWIFGIAINLTRKHFRQQRTAEDANAILGAELGEPHDSWPEDLIDRLDARVLRDVIDSALRSLPRLQLEALTLYAWTELTQREIAAALGVPEGTIKSRLSKARRHLRAFLQASLSEQGDG